MPILEGGALDDKKPRDLINYPSDPVDGFSFASSIEDIKKNDAAKICDLRERRLGTQSRLG